MYHGKGTLINGSGVQLVLLIQISSLNERTDGRTIIQMPERANGQSRDTDSIGYTRYRTEINKAKNTTQKIKKMRNNDSIKKHNTEN